MIHTETLLVYTYFNCYPSNTVESKHYRIWSSRTQGATHLFDSILDGCDLPRDSAIEPLQFYLEVGFQEVLRVIGDLTQEDIIEHLENIEDYL